MAALKGKVKLALDETRMLVLGVQVLVGFQYNNALEPGFSTQPVAQQWLDIACLLLLLVSLGMLISPAAFHQLVENGNSTAGMHRFVTTLATLALLPFAIGLAMAIGTASARAAGPTAGWTAGSLTLLMALLLWYAFGWLNRTRPAKSASEDAMKGTQHNGPPQTEIHVKIEEALTECRVVLPGAQALLGFQFTATVLESFKTLPASSKLVHLLSLGLLSLTIVLLMTPAAFHRIAERGEDSERMHRLTARFLLAAMATLALGLAADLFVILRKVSGSVELAAGSTVAMLLLAYGFWFGYTAYRRAKNRAALAEVQNGAALPLELSR